MYNRYIPNGTAYTRVPEEDAPPFRHPGGSPGRPGGPHQAAAGPGPQQRPPQGERGAPRREEPTHRTPGPGPGPTPGGAQQPPPAWEPVAGGEGGAAPGKKPSWLSGLLKNFKLDDLDTGDILLLLIILFLFIDGDDIELVITLGLLLLFGLGGKKEKGDSA